MPGEKTPPDGHVSVSAIADKLHVDRRVLKRLYELGDLPGVRAGGVIWLERQALAAYLWSRPRCIREDCDRRVIGGGPGCHRHRRSGRHHTVETRRKTSRAQGGEGLPERICEWCGEPFVGRGRRFCSKAHSTAWRNRHGQDPVNLDRLQEGHLHYRDDVERVKTERGLLDVEELLKRLRRAGVPRSPAAVSGHIRAGLLEPERGLGFQKPQLFAEASVDAYIGRLRDYQDGRLSRFNAATPDQAKSRATLYLARHKSAAEFGRVATVLATATGKKPGRPSELDEQGVAKVREMAARGKSQRTIAQTMRVSRKVVRNVLR